MKEPVRFGGKSQCFEAFRYFRKAAKLLTRFKFSSKLKLWQQMLCTVKAMSYHTFCNLQRFVSCIYVLF